MCLPVHHGPVSVLFARCDRHGQEKLWGRWKNLQQIDFKISKRKAKIGQYVLAVLRSWTVDRVDV